MKKTTSVLLYLLAACTLGGCTKDSLTGSLIREKAHVVPVRFSCGPSCDGLIWSIESSSGTYYDPRELPADFQAPRLPVEVTYKRTGERAPAREGGQERIELVAIRRL